MNDDIGQLSIDTIRMLAMDAVQKANAGHPGTAMALAPVAYTIYREPPAREPDEPATGRTATASSSPRATPASSSTRRST